MSDETEFTEDEKKLLGGYSPFVSVLRMIIGPVISQIAVSSSLFIDSIWISHIFGQNGLKAVSIPFLLRMLPISFSQYISSSISLQFSYLIGKQLQSELGQVFIDFIRISFIISLVIPAICLPIFKPYAHWIVEVVNEEEKAISDAWEYCLPIFCCSFVTFIYQMICGILQSGGHSILYGIIELLSLLFGNGFLQFLFLSVFKLGIYASGLSKILSQLILSSILFVFIWRGKYISQPPSLKMFVSKFSSETASAFKAGFANFLFSFSSGLPMLLMQKYLMISALAISHDQLDKQLEMWAIIGSLYQFVGEIPFAVCVGSLPLISYAFGASNFKRILHVSAFALLISFAISVVFAIPVVFFPTTVMKIWSKDKALLDIAEAAIPRTFYLSVTWCFLVLVCIILEAMKEVKLSIISSLLCTLFSLPIICTILYFTDKKNPNRLYWTFTIDDLWCFLLSIVFSIKPLIICLRKSAKDLDADEHLLYYSNILNIKT